MAAGRSGADDGGERAGGPLPGGIGDSATEMGLRRSSAHSSVSAGSAVAVDIPAVRGALVRRLFLLLSSAPGSLRWTCLHAGSKVYVAAQ